MYTTIPGKTLPLQFKIEVNKEQSEALQNHLFKIGYEWSAGGKQLKHLDYNFLFANKDYSIGWANNMHYFERHEFTEIKFEDYFELIQDSTEPTQITYKLKQLLENMTQEEFDKAWEEIRNLKLKGPTIEEYLNSK